MPHRTHLPQATAQRGSNHSDHTDKGETVKLAKLTVPNDASASRHRPRGRRHRAVFPWSGRAFFRAMVPTSASCSDYRGSGPRWN